jgi:hypothetical protein
MASALSPGFARFSFVADRFAALLMDRQHGKHTRSSRIENENRHQYYALQLYTPLYAVNGDIKYYEHYRYYEN